MQIHITGHHIEVTDALRSFTEEKFKKLINHCNDIIAINVIFSIENLDQIAEATVQVTKETMHAKAKHENMYTAITELVKKLDQQLIKHKEKLDSH